MRSASLLAAAKKRREDDEAGMDTEPEMTPEAPLVEAVTETAATASEVVSDAAAGATGAVSDAADAATALVTDAADAASALISDAADVASALVSDAADAAAGAAARLADAASGTPVDWAAAAAKGAASPDPRYAGMTVLVTGASGPTGRRVVEALRARGVAVRALVRDRARAGSVLPTPTAPDAAEPSFDLAVGDVYQYSTLPAALAGVSAVVMVHAASDKSDPLGPFNVDCACTAAHADIRSVCTGLLDVQCRNAGKVYRGMRCLCACVRACVRACV